MKGLLVVVIASVLAGCSSLGGLQNRVEMAALDENTCLGYGFKEGTDAYARCMMELDLLRQADTRDRRARFGASMRQLSRQLLSNDSVTCTSQGSATGSYGTVYGRSTTTCF